MFYAISCSSLWSQFLLHPTPATKDLFVAESLWDDDDDDDNDDDDNDQHQGQQQRH